MPDQIDLQNINHGVILKVKGELKKKNSKKEVKMSIIF